MNIDERAKAAAEQLRSAGLLFSSADAPEAARSIADSMRELSAQGELSFWERFVIGRMSVGYGYPGDALRKTFELADEAMVKRRELIARLAAQKESVEKQP